MFKYVRFVPFQDEYTTLRFLNLSKDVTVNEFDKDIVSLECDDESKIDTLISLQDEKINCEEITKEEFISLYKLTSQYERVLQVSEEILDKALEPILKEYPLQERESWSLQIEEALKYQETNNEADAPYLKGLAEDENDTVENFALAVIAKNTAYKIMHQKALSEKRKAKTALMALVGA